MQTFFKKMGVDDLRFKPAYNPYTEVRSAWPAVPVPNWSTQPSLEIFAFHKGLNKWVEIGNSGFDVYGNENDAMLRSEGRKLSLSHLTMRQPLATMPQVPTNAI